MKPILLGCIADDFTGATDLANNLVRAGMRTLQVIGVPSEGVTSADVPSAGVTSADATLRTEVDAIVVALKSRTIPAANAIEQSLAALKWLMAQGAQQIYFKYCSTFDSTAKGNIGPVAEALMQALNTPLTIATPAFPENQRSVFQGHLFVGDTLLEHSGMRHHPLTPMTDSNLVRVLQAQSTKQVGLINYATVSKGAGAIANRLKELQTTSFSLAIVDAISNQDLIEIGAAVKGMPLVTGGSGLAIGLPQNFAIQPNPASQQLPKSHGKKAVISGSCSVATQGQVAYFLAQGLPSFQIDPNAILAAGAGAGSSSGSGAVDPAFVASVLRWANQQSPDQPVLIYSTASPNQVKNIQNRLGVGLAGELIESTLAAIARGLVEEGVGQLLVAGGETSGACVQALGIDQLQIGPQIDPGVPWCYAQMNLTKIQATQVHATPSTSVQTGLHIALKSGNFGTEDFFTKSFGVLS
jgi:3-dehydrotetronate 4-kinase